MARVFPRGRLTLQEGAGHYPWLDDADTFVGTTAGFLEAE
jgi:pimeloyl-ACP methyl ester carboxylesterase